METGKITKSDKFHKPTYWVVKCDNPDLPGNRNGELPIDPVSHNVSVEHEGRSVTFEVVEIGEVEDYKHYAKLL